MRGRLIAIVAALLIITNVITGLTAFYVAQPTVTAAALCTGSSVSAKAAPDAASAASLGTESASSGFVAQINPPQPQAATVTIVGPWADP